MLEENDLRQINGGGGIWKVAIATLGAAMAWAFDKGEELGRAE